VPRVAEGGRTFLRISLRMSFDRKILQRAFLAFTTGLFLACAARVSAADAATGELGHSAARPLGTSLAK
jgi:hypothetical protein